MECEKLIAIVRRYPVLYDLHHKEYRNLKVKTETWEEVGKEMRKNGKDLKKQWKNLRDCYSKHLRSLHTHTTGPSQAGSNINAYKSWPWAKNMDFLKPFIKFLKNETNVRSDDNSSNHELSLCNYLPQTDNSTAFTKIETPLPIPTTPISIKNIAESENVDTDVEVASPRKRKKRKKETVTGVNAGVVNPRKKKKLRKKTAPSEVDKIISFLQQMKSDTESMDPTELIFLGYARTIRTFSARRQAETNLKISQIVMEQNLLQIEENERNP